MAGAPTVAGPGDSAVRAAAHLVRGLPPTPALWCDGLRKRYGRRTAVDGVSLSVGRGEVVGLLGPNGAGKTTVIKMLLGLVRPDGGEVMVLGRPGSDPAARAGVGGRPRTRCAAARTAASPGPATVVTAGSRPRPAPRPHRARPRRG